MKPIEDLSPEEFEPLLRRAAALPEPPAALVRRALDAFAARPLTPLQAAGVAARRLVAALSFDSWAGRPAAFGMRDMPSEARQMVFTVEGRDVDLRIAPARAGGFVVAGQVLGPDEAGTVELVPAQGEVLTAALDALGEFRIEGVAAGTWQVTLRAGGVEIELPAIDVGERHR